MNEHLNEQLSMYLDGDLAGEDLARTEAHLEACAACRAELDAMRRLVRRARALDDRPPEKDLWAGISSRLNSADTSDVVPLEPRRRRVTFTVPQLAAAALALMALSVAAGTLAGRAAPVAGTPADSVSQGTPDVRLVVNPGDVMMASYDSAIGGLQLMLTQRRSQLDTATVRVVEQSLATIDAAIGQARAALARDPNNGYLNGHLQRALDRKLYLLRQAATMPVAS